MRLIDQGCPPKGKGTRPFDETFLIHQIAANIGMHDQRISRTIWVFNACYIAPLQAIFGIGDRVLIGDFSLRIPLQADTQTRFVHHGEHGAHALVFVTQQKPCCAIIVHHTGRVAVDAHFFFDLANGDRVARPK